LRFVLCLRKKLAAMIDMNWRFLFSLSLGMIVAAGLWYALIAHFGPTLAILAMMALICYVLVKL
jgi:hypothetical protein